ncbi:unnamed protein product [Closterium sp. NIES-53]
MTCIQQLLHVAAQRDYELHSLDFSTAFLQGSLHEEIWLRRPPGFTGSFPAGTHWSLRRPVYGIRQAPHEWNNTLRTTLAALGFTPSTADVSQLLCTDTSQPPFYVLMYVDDLVFAPADTEALTLVKSEMQKRHTCTDLGPSALRLPVLLATAHSSFYRPLALSSTFGQVPRYVASRTSGMGLVLGGRGPVVLTGHADASWELRWLTYLLTDLGEQPRSPPVLRGPCSVPCCHYWCCPPPIFEGCAPSFLASAVASASVATASEVAAVAFGNKGGKKDSKKGGGGGGGGSGGGSGGGGGGGGGGGSGGGDGSSGSGGGGPGSGSVEPQHQLQQQPQLQQQQP